VRIHLVRHGETSWNAEGRLQGQTDIPLNERGLEQAGEAAAALAGLEIAAVFSSDLTRARQTAEVIANRLGLAIEIDPALRERDYGLAEGQLDSDLEREFGNRLTSAWSDPDFTFEGGETSRQVYARVQAFLTKLLRSRPAHDLVVVSHGGTIRTAVGLLRGLPLEDRILGPVANGSIISVELEPAG
jgi:broad specificity phosphatase PhoE